jgi:hypothetical protein
MKKPLFFALAVVAASHIGAAEQQMDRTTACEGIGSYGSAWRQTLGRSAHAWCLAGFNDVNEASRWQEDNFEPASAASWKAAVGTPAQAEAWAAAGFSAMEASPWAAVKMKPATATAWRKQGIEPELAGWLQGALTPEQAKDVLAKQPDLTEWQAVGLDYQYVDGWKAAGLTISDFKKYGNVSVGEAKNAANIQKGFNDFCPQGADQGVTDVIAANPYDTKGVCYNLDVIVPFQLLGQHSGLYDLNGNRSNPFLIKLHFKGSSALFMQNGTFGAIVKGTGVFKYTTVEGAARIIPAFEVGFLTRQ